MIEEYKQHWLEGLRSGEFHQIRHTWEQDSPNKCAIGVLGYFCKSDAHYLDILAETGMDADEMEMVIEMNDRGKTFEQIADAIAEQL